MQTLFVQITPGLEAALADELAELGLRPRVEVGGVEVKGGVDALYAIHLHGRIGARVLVRVGRFGATNLEQLARNVRQVPWARWVHPRQPLDVRVAAHGSRLRHRSTVARKVEFAIQDALRGPRLSSGRPPREAATVFVRIEADRVELSVDASGELLHRRGWRLATAKAPMRENLAAAVLRLAGWQPGEPLVDPMCGSGTFPIEAATIVLGLPPGARRSFAFERWPTHDPRAWEAFRRKRPGVLDPSTPIVGADRDAGAIEAAQGNAQRARVDRRIRLERCAFRDLQSPAPAGLVVANPPYGKRIGEVGASLEELGRVLSAKWAGWRFALVVPEQGPTRRLGLPTEVVARFSNGGVPVALVVGQVPRA